MIELYIPPPIPERNLINGRFLKGHTPHNKGKSMVFKSKSSKRRCVINLRKGWGGGHKTGAGMNRKSVVLIRDRKLICVFSSVHSVAKYIGANPSHVSAACLQKKGHKTVKGYKVFFESGSDWFTEIDLNND